jgi:hypothetical protein
VSELNRYSGLIAGCLLFGIGYLFLVIDFILKKKIVFLKNKNNLITSNQSPIIITQKR